MITTFQRTGCGCGTAHPVWLLPASPLLCSRTREGRDEAWIGAIHLFRGCQLQSSQRGAIVAGLFFLITVAKRIVKIRLYTVFENFWSSSHPEITTIQSLFSGLSHVYSFCFILFFTEMGSYYKSCLAESPMPDEQPGYHPELVRNTQSHASLMLDHNLHLTRIKCPRDSCAHQSWRSSNIFYYMQLVFLATVSL